MVLSFNLEGLKKARRMPQLAAMLRFLDAIKIDGTNAFVINILRAISHEDWAARAIAGRHLDGKTHRHGGEMCVQ